jgi:hypothetical protein
MDPDFWLENVSCIYCTSISFRLYFVEHLHNCPKIPSVDRLLAYVFSQMALMPQNQLKYFKKFYNFEKENKYKLYKHFKKTYKYSIKNLRNNNNV